MLTYLYAQTCIRVNSRCSWGTINISPYLCSMRYRWKQLQLARLTEQIEATSSPPEGSDWPQVQETTIVGILSSRAYATTVWFPECGGPALNTSITLHHYAPLAKLSTLCLVKKPDLGSPQSIRFGDDWEIADLCNFIRYEISSRFIRWFKYYVLFLKSVYRAT